MKSLESCMVPTASLSNNKLNFKTTDFLLLSSVQIAKNKLLIFDCAGGWQ